MSSTANTVMFDTGNVVQNCAILLWKEVDVQHHSSTLTECRFTLRSLHGAFALLYLRNSDFFLSVQRLMLRAFQVGLIQRGSGWLQQAIEVLDLKLQLSNFLFWEFMSWDHLMSDKKLFLENLDFVHEGWSNSWAGLYCCFGFLFSCVMNRQCYFIECSWPNLGGGGEEEGRWEMRKRKFCWRRGDNPLIASLTALRLFSKFTI